jgi:hypothetical protein
MLILKKTHPEWFIDGLRMIDGFYPARPPIHNAPSAPLSQAYPHFYTGGKGGLCPPHPHYSTMIRKSSMVKHFTPSHFRDQPERDIILIKI